MVENVPCQSPVGLCSLSSVSEGSGVFHVKSLQRYGVTAIVGRV